MLANNQMDALIQFAVTSKEPPKKAPKWSAEDDQFLWDNQPHMTDAELAHALGRSEISVHLRWERDLDIPARSKRPEVITANRIALALGIDGHKVAHWFDAGLIPGRVMVGGREIRLVERETFRRWALNPKNWVYFNIHKVQDKDLHRLLQKRAKRWGDEWWSSVQVARYHNVSTGDVKRYIHLGRLQSYRLPVSLGGRHHNRKWSNHFILKSEAVQVKFYKHGDDQSSCTEGARKWMKKALKMGMNAADIAATMKIEYKTAQYWIHRYFPKHKFPKGRAAWSTYRRSYQ